MSSIDSTKEYFLDDDGSGNLRIYSLVAGTRVYSNLSAGAVDYTNGKITLNPIMISAISNVDGVVSTQIRVTVIPNSYDVIPVRNHSDFNVIYLVTIGVLINVKEYFKIYYEGFSSY